MSIKKCNEDNCAKDSNTTWLYIYKRLRNAAKYVIIYVIMYNTKNRYSKIETLLLALNWHWLSSMGTNVQIDRICTFLGLNSYIIIHISKKKMLDIFWWRGGGGQISFSMKLPGIYKYYFYFYSEIRIVKGRSCFKENPCHFHSNTQICIFAQIQVSIQASVTFS